MAFETNRDIEHRFAFHPATSEEKRNEHTSVRMQTLDTALYYNEHLPNGREKAVALTKLEEAMFWANAAIARNNGKPELPPALFALPNAS